MELYNQVGRTKVAMESGAIPQPQTTASVAFHLRTFNIFSSALNYIILK